MCFVLFRSLFRYVIRKICRCFSLLQDSCVAVIMFLLEYALRIKWPPIRPLCPEYMVTSDFSVSDRKTPKKPSRNSSTRESMREADAKGISLSRRKRNGKLIKLDLVGRQDAMRRAEANQNKAT